MNRNALTQAREQIREALSRLNARERNMLVMGSALIGLTLLWLLFGWQAKAHRELDVAVPRAAAQLARMQVESAELARLRSLPTPPAANLAQLVSVLTDTAAGRGLALTVRNDGNQLVVSGKGLNFDNWTQWLAETQRSNSVRLTYLDVAQAPGGPQIEARLSPL
ncbi:type II secretion system protein GspM [Uliginosibacterium sp. H3]|uniref:Type II secretion system protein GspM n=1 Tax=Uliginosibacterium silvisoli TaxID=3114758 RepID=A0ABU6K9E8_9RHOO|nr:type II secretion system protein GspM [Uliginosibacterium sp. H3]